MEISTEEEKRRNLSDELGETEKSNDAVEMEVLETETI
jgi:hypothetical protein